MPKYMQFLSTPPTAESITLDEALTQCHAEAGVEDEWFRSRITAGRQRVEDFIKRSLMPQTWVLRVEGSIPLMIDLPRSPVLELLSVRLQSDPRDETVDIALDDVVLINEGVPAHVVMQSKYASGILRIEYRAGYTSPEFIPQPLKDAILLFVAHSYENRTGERDFPRAFYDLIEPYRLYEWTY